MVVLCFSLNNRKVEKTCVKNIKTIKRDNCIQNDIDCNFRRKIRMQQVRSAGVVIVLRSVNSLNLPHVCKTYAQYDRPVVRAIGTNSPAIKSLGNCLKACCVPTGASADCRDLRPTPFRRHRIVFTNEDTVL
ncbi:uncharacterized protein LOC109853069 [Pseudomyrmex gracilis]|uniref:uncharacterized protein LOC109853069 n=1 Tax=Pseudomyrmex gracilis TaxID=219809 RepID=UPI000994AA38|nr:uncharacterized protein LOC109853069 [Pseudomyrmex gracilis]